MRNCHKIICCLLLFAIFGASFCHFGGHVRSVPETVRTAEASPASYKDNLWLLARVIQGEAGGEPFLGKVAVGAVILNRMRSSSFPNTLAGVIFQPYAFESVTRGTIWRFSPSRESLRAAIAALSGWDPTYGALYFWNPAKPVNPWMWTRRIITQIGRHIFAR